MTNRTRVTLITALTALSLNAGRVWLTGALKSVSLLAIGGGLFVWALVGYFEWRVRFQRRILSDAKNAGRAARGEAVNVVAVKAGVTGKRTLGQGLQSLAGAIGVALLFPVAILIIGLPIALAVRLVVDAVAWLTALGRS
jgi:nitrogen fixation-related uncharacterized protein